MKKILLSLLCLISVYSFFHSTHAATISINSDKNQVVENEIFSTTVFVTSIDQAINNTEAVISFPTDLLSVVSINRSASISTIWVDGGPSFSNSAGTISINGGLPNPGYTGSGGQIVRIVFKAKKFGVANIQFVSASVRANDGLGTDVNTASNGTMVQIAAAANVVEPVVNTNTNSDSDTTTPLAPIVTSQQVTNEQDWFSVDKTTMEWSISNDITGVQVLVDSKPLSIPTKSITPLSTSYEISNLTPGVSYFHVRLRNKNGWGKTKHYKLNIDTASPVIGKTDVVVNKEGIIEVAVSSEDSISGVDRYEVMVDGNNVKTVSVGEVGKNCVSNEITADCTTYSFSLDRTTPGQHEVLLKAFDKAGNVSEKRFTLFVPALKDLQIISYPESIERGKIIVIVGKSPYTNSTLTIWTKNDQEENVSHFITSNNDGTFVYTTDPVTADKTVHIYAEIKNSDGASKQTSDTITIKVRAPFYLVVGSTIIDIYSLVFYLLILLILCVISIIIGRLYVAKLKRKIKFDLTNTEGDVEKTFGEVEFIITKYVNKIESESGTTPSILEKKYILNDIHEHVSATKSKVNKFIDDVIKKDLK